MGSTSRMGSSRHSRSPVRDSSSRFYRRHSRSSLIMDSRYLSSVSMSPCRNSPSILDSRYRRRSKKPNSPYRGSSSRCARLEDHHGYPSTSTPASLNQRASTSERNSVHEPPLPELSRPKRVDDTRQADKLGSLKLMQSDFPLSDARFQKQVLLLLLGIRDNANLAIGINDSQTPFVNQYSTETELVEFEANVEDKPQRSAMKKYFKRICGMDAGYMVKKSMASILTNKLMGEMNMTGKLGKPAVGSLHVCKVIQDTVLEVYSRTSNKVSIQDEMARYLRYAKDRSGEGGRGIGKKNQTNVPANQHDAPSTNGEENVNDVPPANGDNSDIGGS